MTATSSTIPSPDTAWDPHDVAIFLKISDRHLRDVRNEDPTFPPPRMVGSEPRWSPDVMRNWVSGADYGSPKVKDTTPKKRGSGRVH